MSSPRVRCSLGELEGAAAAGVRVFRGIPFAAPPIGERRFAAPAAPEPWPGVRDARRFGAGPIQPADGLSALLGLLGDEVETSEDCLTLNVHVPEGADDAPFPVMVWLHGGAFQTGTAAGPAYDGCAFARRGRVIVVTLNYRVGALGFGACDAAGAVNLGLQDQVAALRFVADEVDAFGGDPERITVFGESAGAGSICALLAMPAARGSFHRAIIQSAAPEGFLSRDEARERFALFCREAGCAPDDLAALRALSPEAILNAQSRCVEPGPRRIGMFFAPVIDGATLPERPLAAAERGATRDVELIAGTTAEEMQLYALIPGFGEMDDDGLARSVAGKLAESIVPSQRRAATERILAAYAHVGPTNRERYFAVETDASLWLPLVRLLEAHAKHQPRTWSYRFSWRSPLREGALGACHALDVPFTLGNRTGERLEAFAGHGPDADRVADQIMDAWAAFGRGDDPGHPGIGGWPCYAPGERATMVFGQNPGTVNDPESGRRNAWPTPDQS